MKKEIIEVLKTKRKKIDPMFSMEGMVRPWSEGYNACIDELIILINNMTQMPEEKPIELEGIKIELDNSLDKYEIEGDGWAAIRKALQSTYLQGVKAGKQEAIIEITHFNWEDGAIKLKEKLSPLT